MKGWKQPTFLFEEYNIKIGFEGISCVNVKWIEMAQNRVKY
jgi:hypothetical protein